MPQGQSPRPESPLPIREDLQSAPRRVGKFQEADECAETVMAAGSVLRAMNRSADEMSVQTKVFVGIMASLGAFVLASLSGIGNRLI